MALAKGCSMHVCERQSDISHFQPPVQQRARQRARERVEWRQHERQGAAAPRQREHERQG